MKFFNQLKSFATFEKSDIFYKISGHDEIKWLLEKALASEEPVHILLVGKPGLGKTQFLEAIEKEKENSYLALGSGAISAGMIDGVVAIHRRHEGRNISDAS